jgi:hypothetical protein
MAHHRCVALLLVMGAFIASGGAQARIIPPRALDRNNFCAREPAFCQAPVNRRRLSEKRAQPVSAADAPHR